MPENYVVARPYAKAVFAAAKEQNDFGKWSLMLNTLVAIVKNERAISFLENPLVDNKQREALFLDVCDKLLNNEAKNLLKLLILNKRLVLLPELAKIFEELRAEQEQLLLVKVTTAFDLTVEQKDKLTAVLRKRFNMIIKLQYETNNNLIGGLIIRAGNKIIDASILGQLNKLKKCLIS